ncbi:MAG TPA: phosphoglycerate mutase family protein, partial [Candidatus Sulfotelmatobacter sp.]|nr:phosphoglycerate mutase family protein [Candidatus Sulfotelmatobacter sp.]
MNSKNSYKFCTIYLVRHAQSKANLTGIMGGDSGLTNDGEKQALALGKKFKNIDFAAVFSSVKKRAIQTAQL